MELLAAGGGGGGGKRGGGERGGGAVAAQTQGHSQDLETGCLKLAFVKFLGVQIFKGDHNILRFQP